MDDVDYGCKCADQFLKAAMCNQQSKSAGSDESALTCADCGETIPQERRLAAPGCKLCVICQSLAERNEA